MTLPKPIDVAALSDATLASFWQRVDKMGPVRVPDLGACWEWRGAVDGCGYGRLRIGRRQIPAHRLALALSGESLGQQLVCHRCDNPRCVRVDHLFLGDQLRNMSDCASKRRHNFGEGHPSAVVDEEDVRTIRIATRIGVSTHDLGKIFGLHPSTVRDIATGRYWSHVPEPPLPKKGTREHMREIDSLRTQLNEARARVAELERELHQARMIAHETLCSEAELRAARAVVEAARWVPEYADRVRQIIFEHYPDGGNHEPTYESKRSTTAHLMRLTVALKESVEEYDAAVARKEPGT